MAETAFVLTFYLCGMIILLIQFVQAERELKRCEEVLDVLHKITDDCVEQKYQIDALIEDWEQTKLMISRAETETARDCMKSDSP